MLSPYLGGRSVSNRRPLEQKTRAWLKTQEEGIYSNSHKAALLRSIDPFGLFATYKDEMGVEYHYLNGKIDCIDYDGQTIRFDD